jgi:TPR repeat protein
MPSLKHTTVRTEQEEVSVHPMARLAVVVTLTTVVLAAAQRSAHAAPTPVPEVQSATSRIESNLSAQGSAGFSDRIFQQGMFEFNAGNHETAVSLWEVAAHQGHLYAQYNLGIVYVKGIGIHADVSRAVYWWREAAIQGNTDAQYNLGVLYAEGNGVEKNIAEASVWWRLAAQGGDAAAQYNLGLLLARGDGIAQDVERAIWWFQKSAAQGFESAVRALEKLKARGVSLQTAEP